MTFLFAELLIHYLQRSQPEQVRVPREGSFRRPVAPSPREIESPTRPTYERPATPSPRREAPAQHPSPPQRGRDRDR